MSSQPAELQAERPRPPKRFWIVAGTVSALLLLIVVVLSLNGGSDAAFVTGGNSTLMFALPAFLAGVFSFLSPCTLPILPAYFAFTFQARRGSVVLMSTAFFLGLATTLTLIGASATALSGLLFDNKATLTFWGGVIVIGFGLMAMLGKGFGGVQVAERPVASLAGSYLYGATFALGWSACVGPILGALLTLLATTSGIAILQGAVLAFIYALGLGLPLILIAAFFNRLGSGSRFWQVIKGRGFELKFAGHSFYLHTTSIISGLLMILMGAMLASGQLEQLSARFGSSGLARWVADLEGWLVTLFGL